ncbi:MAG TPA: GNAT family N-acetyltransferase [Acidimicrobiales bacterium]|nr:GNAT family N-acetyltransferase [Acidimicrobiales bacterium]
MPSKALIRSYTDSDRDAARRLWSELTEHHRQLYQDPELGGPSPGLEFDNYLLREERVATWVAVLDDEVVGLAGLLDHGDSGEVEPVITAEPVRRKGIGRDLLGTAIEEARRRHFLYLAIRPVARNVDAISAFHAEGFRTLGGHLDLTLDLAVRKHQWHHGATLHGLDFDY